MKDKRWGDKITPQNITRDYDDVISRNQIRGSKMAVLKLALLGEQEPWLSCLMFTGPVSPRRHKYSFCRSENSS